MTNLTRWKVIGYAAALFIAGAATGSVVTHGLSRHPKVAHKRDIIESIRNRLQTRLNLTPEQQQKIEPFLQQAGEKFKAIHDNSVKDFARASDELDAQIATVLTPEQRAKLEEMCRERRDFVHKGFSPQPEAPKLAPK
jgi:Spy/CpxP family protein refolding chaperone